MAHASVLLLLLTVSCGRIGYSPVTTPALTGDGGAGDDGPPEPPEDASPRADAVPCPATCVCEGRAALERSVCRETVTWVRASASCAERGLRLVRVDDTAENTQLRESARRLGLYHLWLGGTDLEMEGTWRWLDGNVFYSGRADGGVAVSSAFVNWARTEPNDVNGGEDCLLMLTESGSWNDATCDSTPAAVERPWGYACERP